MTMTASVRDAADAKADGRRGRAGLVLAVLLLTGCPGTTINSDQGSIQTETAKGLAMAPPVPKPKPAQRSNAVVTAKKAEDAVPTTQTHLAALPPEASPGGKADPNALVGLDQNQTRRLLGSPASTEEAPPSKVWRYAKGDCTLKVYFFMDMTSSQDFRALSYDMKSSDNVPDADSRCFAQLLAQAWDASHD
ncbi:hypothetical protein [Azospirillum sp. SYSU D00513]|uniref:hypothetical protein n=1 Tax=Azospirillum sp. SYSU D00513 TaxID=2812561 RepID=UPI001FFF8744|nr:hypothetical protein [Azospirillum sp. SYSU D00513]